MADMIVASICPDRFEDDRRRVQIELARPNADDSEENTKVAVMDKWRQKLG